MKTDKAIDRLNALLRGELAATETYQQALEKVHNEPGATELRRLHTDHREALTHCGSTFTNTAESRTKARASGALSPRPGRERPSCLAMPRR